MNTDRGCPCEGAGRTFGSECLCGSTAKPCRNKVSNITFLRLWKLNLKGKTYFFCIVLSLFCCDASKYKNGGYVWVRDINEHKSCLLRVPDLCSRSASGVYPILLACIIVTFHIDCHYFFIWILWENYFHSSNSNIFHCMNSTTIYYRKLTSKFIFLCFEQPGGDTIQFRRTEGPSLIKLKAGPLRKKKGWGKTMM